MKIYWLPRDDATENLPFWSEYNLENIELFDSSAHVMWLNWVLGASCVGVSSVSDVGILVNCRFFFSWSIWPL